MAATAVTDLIARAEGYVADNLMLVEQYRTISQIQRFIDDTAIQTAHLEQMDADHGYPSETEGMADDELVDRALVEERDEVQRLFDAHVCVFVQHAKADGVNVTELDVRYLIEEACVRVEARQR